MDITSIVFMITGLLLIVFAVIAVVSTIRGVSYITSGEDEPKLSLQEKLVIINQNN